MYVSSSCGTFVGPRRLCFPAIEQFFERVMCKRYDYRSALSSHKQISNSSLWVIAAIHVA
jgi:hypothetical protein